MIASSAHTVFPLPVGAATKQLSSLLYSAVKTCVWIGLKAVKPLKRASKVGLRRALRGSGCKSSSSVGGRYFSGSSRWRNDTGRVASHCSHLSLTTWCEGGAFQHYVTFGVWRGVGKCGEGDRQQPSRKPLTMLFCRQSYLDKVLGRKGFVHRYCEAHHHVVLCKLLLQHKVLVVKQVLAVGIFHQDPKGLHHTVHFFL